MSEHTELVARLRAHARSIGKHDPSRAYRLIHAAADRLEQLERLSADTDDWEQRAAAVMRAKSLVRPGKPYTSAPIKEADTQVLAASLVAAGLGPGTTPDRDTLAEEAG